MSSCSNVVRFTGQHPLVGELTVSWGEPTTIILLKRTINLSSKFHSLGSQTSAAQTCSMPKLTTGQSAENECQPVECSATNVASVSHPSSAVSHGPSEKRDRQTARAKAAEDQSRAIYSGHDRPSIFMNSQCCDCLYKICSR